MQIECHITDIDPSPDLLTFFQNVLEHAAEKISLDRGTIGRVIIASYNLFGSAVSLIKPGATHTDNETGVAGGKTFPRVDGDVVVCDIVLQASLFNTLGEVLSIPPISHDWKADHEQALYVICHEFGHAMDHAIRTDVAEVPDPRSADFSITDTANYYGNIVLDEYAACKNAAVVMTETLFDYEMSEASGRVTDYQTQVSQYLGDPDQLTRRALAHFVCQGAWVIMVELAKLYGHTNCVSDRREAVCNIEDGLLGATPLTDILNRYESSYPNWDTPSQVMELAKTWHMYGDSWRSFRRSRRE